MPCQKVLTVNDDKQFRRNRETILEQYLTNLLNLALSLSLPIFSSFNSNNFSHHERRCLSYISKLECPRNREGGKVDYKCSQTKEMVLLNHRGLLRIRSVPSLWSICSSFFLTQVGSEISVKLCGGCSSTRGNGLWLSLFPKSRHQLLFLTFISLSGSVLYVSRRLWSNISFFSLSKLSSLQELSQVGFHLKLISSWDPHAHFLGNFWKKFWFLQSSPDSKSYSPPDNWSV